MLHSTAHIGSTLDSFRSAQLSYRIFNVALQIFIEHKLVARFAHYVPLTNISHIYINGDVELYSVSWEGKYYVSVSLRPKTNLLLQAIPYAADIPGNFYPGRKLYVSALAKNRAKQFTIDFHSGEEIACRVNPRFPAKVWENYIVRTM